MRFGYLKIENFFAISDAQVDLADQGLVLVQGENKDESSADSNGAGKSTLPDALCWCLYGQTARGVVGDAVVNRKAKKNTMVGVSILESDDLYEVIRWRKHKKFKNKVFVTRIAPDGTSTDLTKGTDKETQTVIGNILGCSYDVFRAAIYAGQEEMPNLPGMTDKILKTLIEQAAGIEVLERAYDIARSRARDVEARNTAVEDELSRLGDKERMILDEISNHEAQSEIWEKTRKQRLEENKARIREMIKNTKKLKTEIEDKDEVEGALAEIDATLKGVEGENKKRAELEDALRGEVTVEAAAKANMDGENNALTNAIEKCDAVSENVGENCDECGKPIEIEDVAEAQRIAENKVVETSASHAALKQAFEDASESVRERQGALSKFIDDMTMSATRSQRRASLDAPWSRSWRSSMRSPRTRMRARTGSPTASAGWPRKILTWRVPRTPSSA